MKRYFVLVDDTATIIASAVVGAVVFISLVLLHQFFRQASVLRQLLQLWFVVMLH